MISTEQFRRDELLQRLAETAGQRLPERQNALPRREGGSGDPGGDGAGETIQVFLRACYARVPLGDIEDRSTDQLLASAYNHWQLGCARPPGRARVRAYNPDVAEHGWSSAHSVVDMVNDDMPFLVDSVIAEIHRRGLTAHLLLHPVLRVRRDAAGTLADILPPHPGGQPVAGAGDAEDEREDAAGRAESFIHVEITRQPADALPELEAAMGAILDDVRAAVDDFPLMRAELHAAIATQPTAEETGAFLQWLYDEAFTFLGTRRYTFPRESGGMCMRAVAGSGLGLLRGERDGAGLPAMGGGTNVPPQVAAFLDGDAQVMIGKSTRRSTVHRPAHMDEVLIRQAAEGGSAEVLVMLGLFSAAVYHRSARNVPLLRAKLAQLLARAGFERKSHDGRALANIVETFPRDELFQIALDDLYEIALGILQLQHRQRVALFVRRDDFERFVSCLVFVPRDRYTTQLRLAIQGTLERAYDGSLTAISTALGDTPLARLHLIIQTQPGKVPEVDAGDLERDLVAISRSWSDRLLDALSQQHDENETQRLCERYAEAFPLGYRERATIEQAIVDIHEIELLLGRDEDVRLAAYRPFGSTDMQFRFKIYHPDQPVILSHVLPLLEHLGLRVMEEMPYAVRLRGPGARTVMLHDFGLETRRGAAIALGEMSQRFGRAFHAVWRGEVESDGLNALVLSAGLDVHEVVVLRAYTKYLRQAGIPFTQAYLERVLTTHPAITGAIVRLFVALFDPDAGDAAAPGAEERAAPLRAEIAAALDGVASAEDDRILRRFRNLVESTLRTNWFQRDVDGGRKPYLAVKLDSRAVDDLPLPRPMVEVWVYSVRMEGIHLRGGKVARGGIRWSDRREDFRTEVLGLMKAQTVKNAVIVPVGAKGGFVVKRPQNPDRDAWQAEGIGCYRMLIRGLLDVTDNLTAGRVQPPARVLRRDGDDPYLVVAADKGTATFSDIANGIAADYGFWLGDAFASGGSQGYDHKAMGITARGAWESVKRHFTELGQDTQRQDFTAVGVGDMSGDVFGNGMLLSRHIRLLAAFDHRHVFVDPDPDPAVSFEERARLFLLPRSSWASYDPARLSAGGRVFERTAKQLVLTAEIRARFGLAEERVTPAQLIRALLTAEVDLLWLGGVGTFVKAGEEAHAEVGDRSNDAIRVDAHDLRARVIGEGANLGITQLGRIEYARGGGRLNTDFIDNSAGVDCSDHEVNIKILLGAVTGDGELTTKQRNDLLAAMTDEVAALVLRDNYLQTQALSLIAAEGADGLDGQVRLMRRLERRGRLNRSVEFLPDDEALAERATKRQGLTRPELAVLFSHAKIWVNEELLASGLPDDAHLAGDLARYFPDPVRQRFEAWIARHPLRRELVATTITNSLINRMGGTFVADLVEKTGLAIADIARAYLIARTVFDTRALWEGIEALDGVVASTVQIDLHRQLQALLDRQTQWFLRNGGTPPAFDANVARYAGPVATLTAALAEILPAARNAEIEARAGGWTGAGVPGELARRVAETLVLPSACDIIRLADTLAIPVESVARCYFSIGEAFGFGWLRDRASLLSGMGYWQRLAVAAVVDELYAHQRDVTQSVLSAGSCASSLAAWMAARQAAVDRCRSLLAEIEAARAIDLSMLTVASRQLRALTES